MKPKQSRKSKTKKKTLGKSKGKTSCEINKKMTFGEIMNRYPKAAEIFIKKGMHCFGCGLAFAETLEQGALMHGINPDKLVDELNRRLKKLKK